MCICVHFQPPLCGVCDAGVLHSHFLDNLDGIHETGGAKSLRPESGLIFACTSEILVMSCWSVLHTWRLPPSTRITNLDNLLLNSRRGGGQAPCIIIG